VTLDLTGDREAAAAAVAAAVTVAGMGTGNPLLPAGQAGSASTQGQSDRSRGSGYRRHNDSVTSLLEAVADAFAGVSGSDSRAGSARRPLASQSPQGEARAPPPSPVLSGRDGESGSDRTSSPRLTTASPLGLLRPSLERLDLGQRDYDSDASDMCDDVPVTPAWLAEGDAGGVFARQAVTGRVERPAMLHAVEEGAFPGDRRRTGAGRQPRARHTTGAAARQASPLSREAVASASAARMEPVALPKPAPPSAEHRGESSINASASPQDAAGQGPADALISPPWVRGGGTVVDLGGIPVTVDSDGDY
jgi:hypothetical protein